MSPCACVLVSPPYQKGHLQSRTGLASLGAAIRVLSQHPCLQVLPMHIGSSLQSSKRTGRSRRCTPLPQDNKRRSISSLVQITLRTRFRSCKPAPQVPASRCARDQFHLVRCARGTSVGLPPCSLAFRCCKEHTFHRSAWPFSPGSQSRIVSTPPCSYQTF